ncbi:ribose-phosphate diphosphokinase [Microbulbifer thermotolerans]|uniref:ribose-phosphate diphosphokinase n=1 Tax=Microbulbifer thermotolerans TaxID=252514 RepID=A0A143HHN3_MICTH|nr:ribose-phosphate diphosphokinase [Microbulbifer thermotolerans]AMX01229.1 ribose-phosphate pyrophosphokinase [Microbulbifer thermotolerans]MCX2830874.1 ribose-phosphate diphosphokinase [Microbulbifer thermotolerans]MCX2840833.1 ribose-phosphate diphosphokinase [Microbulbifer thermotolerans]
MNRLKLFSLDAGAEFAGRVAAALGEPLAAHEERAFIDGEHKIRPLDDVEGADTYLVQSLYSDERSSVNDKLIRMLFFIGALKDAGAARVTAVIPYLCYGRKDRRTKLHDPLSNRYLATLFESLGTDGIVTLDAHNQAAFENAFRCRTLHLLAQPLFVDFIATALKDSANPLVVASPDLGGIKRAERFHRSLAERLARNIGRAFVEKYRSADQLSGGTLAGDVWGADVVLVDDLIAGGGTVCRAVDAVLGGGAARIWVLASHGQFCGDALRKLAQLPLEAVAVTNSLPQPSSPRLEVIDCARLLAEGIRRLHDSGPAAQLSVP